MIDLLRVVGFVLIAVGALVFGSWFIDPLRELWPAFLELPLPLRLGITVAAVGLVLLFATVVWERMKDREKDRSLLDDDL